MTMFSATMPPSVERLAKCYLRRPAIVTVGNAGQVVDRIAQTVEIVAEHEKPNRLMTILKDFSPPMIIFVNQKSTVDALYTRLNTHGYKAIALHGGKGQEQREAAISQLKQGTKDILIATDVASRGIDVRDITLVLNYDMAKTIEDYVHRIGRTGRAGKQGTAVTFVNDRDVDVFYDLRAMLQKSANTNMPPEFANHEAARQRPGAVQQKKRHEEKIFAYGV
jgi:ATP-dependent RNA helicase DDX23/PRP28